MENLTTENDQPGKNSETDQATTQLEN
jgi:hypothetical protein